MGTQSSRSCSRGGCEKKMLSLLWDPGPAFAFIWEFLMSGVIDKQ